MMLIYNIIIIIIVYKCQVFLLLIILERDILYW